MQRGHAFRPSYSPTFAAIDFETADYGRDSACAVAVVRVEGRVVVDRVRYYIRPPRRHFVFSYLHGIS
jgi:DNA polymerase-3 subunit epsilon